MGTVATEVEFGSVVLVEPGVDERTETAAGDPATDWLCAWCLNRVANDRDRFNYGGQDEFTFVNPQRIRFEIITFSTAFGCRQFGTPTMEDTWFPGHAWCYCQCDECNQHLGWHYSGQHQFVGLIKPRIVRAIHVRN